QQLEQSIEMKFGVMRTSIDRLLQELKRQLETLESKFDRADRLREASGNLAHEHLQQQLEQSIEMKFRVIRTSIDRMVQEFKRQLETLESKFNAADRFREAHVHLQQPLEQSIEMKFGALRTSVDRLREAYDQVMNACEGLHNDISLGIEPFAQKIM